MDYRSLFHRRSFIALLGVILFFSCRPITDGPVPEDMDPAITLLAPSSNNFLQQEGEVFTVSLQLTDNEALHLLRVVGRLHNEQDSVIGEDFIVSDIDIEGTNINYDLSLTAPAVPGYYRIRYTIHVLDSKGAEASTFVWLTVLPEPIDPKPFEVLRYEGDSIFNLLLSQAYGFNFTSREILPNPWNQNELELDIAEVSGSLGGWEPRLSSPNNAFFGQDSVFVLTDASRFNYEEATYETIFQAFFSDPLPKPETPVLEVGDYVIVRLTKSPQPQFAVMKITDLYFDGGGAANNRDILFFDYLVTSQ